MVMKREIRHRITKFDLVGRYEMLGMAMGTVARANMVCTNNLEGDLGCIYENNSFHVSSLHRMVRKR